MTNPQQKPLLRFVIGLILASLAAVLLLELLVRLLRLAPPLETRYDYFAADPVLPFKPKPNTTLQGGSIGGEFSFEHAHNSLGLRDREHARPKPAGSFRILILGDSFTYGIGAAVEDGYPARLERTLNQQTKGAPPVEVINAGIPRYFPEAERLLLEHYGMQFEPDLVIAAFVPNDLAESSLGLDAVAPDPRHGFLVTKEARMLGEIGVFLFRHWQTFRILWIHGVSDRIWFDPHIRASGAAGETPGLREAWRKVKDEYAKMNAITARRKARFAVLFIPPKGPPWPEKAAEELAAWCREHGVPFIDAIPAMKDAALTRQLYWEKDMHCNAEGYRVLADALHRGLAEQQLLP